MSLSGGARQHAIPWPDATASRAGFTCLAGVLTSVGDRPACRLPPTGVAEVAICFPRQHQDFTGDDLIEQDRRCHGVAMAGGVRSHWVLAAERGERQPGHSCPQPDNRGVQTLRADSLEQFHAGARLKGAGATRRTARRDAGRLGKSGM